MKVNCNKTELYRTLNSILHAVESRTSSAIFECVLVEIKGNDMVLTSTNSKMTIESTIAIVSEGDFSFAVPAKMFADIVGKLPEEEVVLDYDSVKATLHIISGRYQSELICFDPEDFPKVKLKNEDIRITLNKESFRKLIKKTAFSASTDEINGILTGVLCEIDAGNFRMVAVDAFRMAIYNETVSDATESLSVVIPAKQLNEVSKFISDDGDENLVMGITDNKAVLHFDNNKVTLNTMSGKYIDYKRIIKAESSTEIRVKKDDLIRSIERAALMANRMNNNMIKFDIQDDVIEISSLNDQGNMNEKIEIIKNGDSFRIGFNSKYLIDILRNVEDEEINMYLKDSISPCIIKPLSGDRYLYLVLPVRIN